MTSAALMSLPARPDSPMSQILSPAARRVSCDEVGGDSGQKGPGDGVEHLDGCDRGKHDQAHFDRPSLDATDPKLGRRGGLSRPLGITISIDTTGNRSEHSWDLVSLLPAIICYLAAAFFKHGSALEGMVNETV